MLQHIPTKSILSNHKTRKKSPRVSRMKPGGQNTRKQKCETNAPGIRQTKQDPCFVHRSRTHARILIGPPPKSSLVSQLRRLLSIFVNSKNAAAPATPAPYITSALRRLCRIHPQAPFPRCKHTQRRRATGSLAQSAPALRPMHLHTASDCRRQVPLTNLEIAARQRRPATPTAAPPGGERAEF